MKQQLGDEVKRTNTKKDPEREDSNYKTNYDQRPKRIEGKAKVNNTER